MTRVDGASALGAQMNSRTQPAIQKPGVSVLGRQIDDRCAKRRNAWHSGFALPAKELRSEMPTAGGPQRPALGQRSHQTSTDYTDSRIIVLTRFSRLANVLTDGRIHCIARHTHGLVRVDASQLCY